MAIRKISKRPLNAVELMSVSDDAIDVDASDFTLYNEDPIKNRDALKFKDNKQPTVFLCNFELTGREQAILQNAQMAGQDENKDQKSLLGSYVYNLTRMTLKNIINDPNESDVIKMKFDSKRYVDDSVMTVLCDNNIHLEIAGHYMTLKHGSATETGTTIKN